MFNKNQNNREEQLIQQQMDIARDGQMLGAATHDDETYIHTQEAKSDFLKWQQNLEDELENLKNRLRGYAKDENGKWTKKMVKQRVFNTRTQKPELITVPLPPLTNELFIDYIEMQCEPFMSRNLFNSSLDETRILNQLRNTMNDIADAMADGWDIYEIDFTNYDLVCRLIKNVIIPGPFRALAGWTKKTDSSMIKRIEAIQDRPLIIQKKGLFKGLFGG